MKSLEASEAQRLSTILGWLGLGLLKEASQELEKISEDSKGHPDALEVRCLVYEKVGRWDIVADAARHITYHAPDRAFGWFHLAFALNELKLTSQSYDTLLPILEKFPNDWQMHYNMACYASKLARWSDAWFWLEKSFTIGNVKEITLMALEDPDLQPLWTRMGMPKKKA